MAFSTPKCSRHRLQKLKTKLRNLSRHGSQNKKKGGKKKHTRTKKKKKKEKKAANLQRGTVQISCQTTTAKQWVIRSSVNPILIATHPSVAAICPLFGASDVRSVSCIRANDSRKSFVEKNQQADGRSGLIIEPLTLENGAVINECDSFTQGF